MKQRIEKYLPKAIEFISEVEIANSDGVVDSRFNGYFSAFGAAIIQSGMKPALAFYANDKTTKDRSNILKAVYKLIVPEAEQDNPVEAKSLLKYYIDNETNPMLKHKILDATVALKLAVRTYELKKQ